MTKPISLTDRLATLAPGLPPEVIAHLVQKGLAEFHHVHSDWLVMDQVRAAEIAVSAQQIVAQAAARPEQTMDQRIQVFLAERYDMSKVFGAKKLFLHNHARREIEARDNPVTEEAKATARHSGQDVARGNAADHYLRQVAGHNGRLADQGNRPVVGGSVVTSAEVPAQGEGPLDPMSRLRLANRVLAGIPARIAREHSNLAARLSTIKDYELRSIAERRLENLRREALIHGLAL